MISHHGSPSFHLHFWMVGRSCCFMVVWKVGHCWHLTLKPNQMLLSRLNPLGLPSVISRVCSLLNKIVKAYLYQLFLVMLLVSLTRLDNGISSLLPVDWLLWTINKLNYCMCKREWGIGFFYFLLYSKVFKCHEACLLRSFFADLLVNLLVLHSELFRLFHVCFLSHIYL